MTEAIGIGSLSLAAGYILYERIPFFKKWLIQPALSGGFFLLLGGPYILNLLPERFYEEWKSWPGTLITFLFVLLILSQPVGEKQKRSVPVTLQGILVWVLATGQITTGFAVVLIFGMDPLFAHIIEIGWMGGHGSAAAFMATTETLGNREAGELALISATVGLLYGSLSGMVLINLIKRTTKESASQVPEEITASDLPAVTNPAKELILTALFAGVCVWLAILLRAGAAFIESQFTISSFTSKLPLFFIALLVAVVMRIVLIRAGIINQETAVTAESANHIVLDALILSAVATLNLPLALDHTGPLMLLMAAGAVWVLIVFFFVSKMLPDELRNDLRIINYGMSTGITALGLMLLKSARSSLPQKPVTVYGLAAPLSAPFIGGGVISLLLPVLNNDTGPGRIFPFVLAATVILTITGFYLKRKYSE